MKLKPDFRERKSPETVVVSGLFGVISILHTHVGGDGEI